MGAYSYLSIAGYPTFSNKNTYYEEIVNLLFLAEDYFIEQRSFTEKNKLYWGDAYENDEGEFTFKGFRQTVAVCKKRLELFGYSLELAKREWNDIRKTVKDGYDMSDYFYPIEKVSFAKYYNELTNIIENKIINYEQVRDSLQNCLIADELEMQGLSLGSALYTILSASDQADFVEYEFSEIIEFGWVVHEPVDRINLEKIILLTEGRTDAKILDSSLKMLYPEFHPYYQFMDFEGLKPEGGASALVRTIKAFSGAGIKHPVIAIFDNDTAGMGEMAKLPDNLQSNITAIKLPDIDLAKKYPTIGPAGLRRMNINKLACGIEIYLSKEILMTTGELAPVRWTNYDLKLKRYQGSLINKEEVQKVFERKIAKGERWDMPEMEKFFSNLFNAFQNNK